MDPGLVQKLSEYLVSLSDKNETETKTTGGGFLTARVQRRPTGWMVKNKKAQQEKKDLKIDEKISVQLVSPNRGFKF